MRSNRRWRPCLAIVAAAGAVGASTATPAEAAPQGANSAAPSGTAVDQAQTGAEASCDQSEACRKRGHCHARQGECVATSDDDWLKASLETMRSLHDLAKPTFASCWGFQAMARAMGGEVIKDLSKDKKAKKKQKQKPEQKPKPEQKTKK